MAWTTCEEPGCNARVTVGQHTRCSHHRPRPPRTDRYENPAKRAKDRATKWRRRAAAGVLWA